MTIAIGADHGGFELKKDIITELARHDIESIDVGATIYDPLDDYPRFANLVATKVQKNKTTFGILLCKSGAGMCIVANKWNGIRAVNIHTPAEAVLARAHNNANVLCLSADTLKPKVIIAILKKFLTTSFEHGRHQRRIDQITALENKNHPVGGL